MAVSLVAKISEKLVLLLTHGLVMLLFAWGAYDVLTNYPENDCEMTYMFEYPQYVKIPLDANVSQAFPRYSLYAYGEGKYTEKLREMKFSGIPVLFVPGNAGSYKQVRSLASVALRKSWKEHHFFNFFAADLNEELSALYGGVLEEQTAFVAECVKRILLLYTGDNKYKPSSVLIVGHSMGGLVARHLFLLDSFNPSWVHTIVTLATPHTSPVLSLDIHLHLFHQRLLSYWRQHRSTSLAHLVLASVGGGHRDLLVRAGLTLPSDLDMSIVATAVPADWASTDHRCIVWCKQLVLVLIRAFFDMVDSSTRQLTTDADLRRTILSYHLIRRTAGVRMRTSSHPPKLMLGPGEAQWKEVQEPKGSMVWEQVRGTNYVLFPLISEPSGEFVMALLTINSKEKDWAFACHAKSKGPNHTSCMEGKNLSPMGAISPTRQYKRKELFVDVAVLLAAGFTHLGVKLGHNKDPVRIDFDQFLPSERFISVHVPQWPFPWNQNMLDNIHRGNLVVQVNLKGFQELLQAFQLHIQAQECAHSQHHATISLQVPWAHEDTHFFVRDSEWHYFPLRLQVAKPPSFDADAFPTLRFMLDPSCSYTIRLQMDWASVLGQAVRFHLASLPSWAVGISILALSAQLSAQGQLSGEGICPAFHAALLKRASPLLLAFPMWLMGFGILPWTDIPLVSQGGFSKLLLLGTQATAWGIVFLLSLAVWAAVIAFGNFAHSIVVRVLMKHVHMSERIVDFLVKKLTHFPVAVAVVLTALSLSTCGAVGLVMGFLLYFFKLFKMYEDYLEGLLGLPNLMDLVHRLRRTLVGNRRGRREDARQRSGDVEGEGEEKDGLSALHWHFSMAFLWLWATLLNLPCLLVWITNFGLGMQLRPDPSFPTAFVLCACLAILWQPSMPSPYLKHSKLMSIFLHVLAVITVAYSCVSIYRLNMFISITFIMVSLYQALDSQAKQLEYPIEAELKEKKGNEEEESQEQGPSSSNATASKSQLEEEVGQKVKKD